MDVIEQQNLMQTIVGSMDKPLQEVLPTIQEIDKKYPNNVIIKYYIGLYYKKHNIEISVKYLNECIRLDPTFSAPYYDVADFYIKKEEECIQKDRENKVKTMDNMGRLVYIDFRKKGRPHFTKAENMLLSIFNKPLTDYKTAERKKGLSFDDNLRIASILTKIYMADRQFDDILKLYDVILKQFDELSPKIIKNKSEYMICWKNIHLDLGQIYFHRNDYTTAYRSYYNGFKHGFKLESGSANEQANYLINRYLLEACLLTRHYIPSFPKLPCTVDKIYDDLIKHNFNDYSSYVYEKPLTFELKDYLGPTRKKIKIGYFTPDFNKNAVGLFVTPLVSCFNSDEFDITVYYMNKDSDSYTLMFKTCYNIRWIPTSSLPEKQIAKMIIADGIDILFDLIGHGHGNKLEVLKLLEQEKVRPKIITYLGYPDTTMLKIVDYRLVDKFTDPFDHEDISEKLLRIPGCFVCYKLFENEMIPEIKYKKAENNKFRIGIFNKSAKHSSFCISDWKYILEKCKNVELYIKLDQHSEYQRSLYKDLPKDQVKYIPFQDILPSYFDIYNHIELCLDTYPYSGTTTTCSSLFMGIPVFAVYDKEDTTKRHVNNVSGSILMNSELPEYICETRNILRFKVIEYIKNFNPDIELHNRSLIREKFLKCMNPKKFMASFEHLMKTVLEESKIYPEVLVNVNPEPIVQKEVIIEI